MRKKERALLAIEALEERYPDAKCSLDYKEPYELLIATRLSAQCTDARVNIVTEKLFKDFTTLESIAQASVEEIEGYVRTCGLYRTKARDIVAMSNMLIEEFDSVVPDSIEQLLRLPGVGRKTANLIVGDIYGKTSVVCDTHCLRICNLLGLIETKDPFKAEMALRKILPEEKSGDFCHRLVLHGRDTCVARRPKCSECCMQPFCKFGSGAK